MTDKTPTFCELTFYKKSDHSSQAIQILQIVAELHWSKTKWTFYIVPLNFYVSLTVGENCYPCHDILSYNMYV